MRFLFLFCSLFFSTLATAAEQAVEVVVEVVDEAGEPITTATLRHPSEKDKRKVNMENGTWRGQTLYLPNGEELHFVQGTLITFEVSAPGHVNATVQYIVRKRKNRIIVMLPAGADLNELDDDDPVIAFKRDKPRE
jgi:hypothetical protein